MTAVQVQPPAGESTSHGCRRAAASIFYTRKGVYVSMFKINSTERINAYKSTAKRGDTVEIAGGNGTEVINIGKVLKVIVEAGIVVALIVKIIA